MKCATITPGLWISFYNIIGFSLIRSEICLSVCLVGFLEACVFLRVALNSFFFKAAFLAENIVWSE